MKRIIKLQCRHKDKNAHTEPKTGLSRRKNVTLAAIAAGCILALCFLAAFAILQGYLNKIQYDPGITSIRTDVTPEMENAAATDSPQIDIEALEQAAMHNLFNSPDLPAGSDSVFHVLLIGTDNRTSGAVGRSDSMVLISVNKNTSAVIATSLLRDIYLQIPDIGWSDRLNTAYAYGGASLLLKTIQENFKIDVSKYIAVDFFAFIEIIDALGGVTIEIDDSEINTANGYIQEINELTGLHPDDGKLVSGGLQLLNGKQALAYSRIRYVGNADFGRTDRQRVVLQILFETVQSCSIGQLSDLLNVFLPEVTTNLTRSELTTLLFAVPAISDYSFESWYIPVEGSYSYLTIRGMSVLGIDFNANISELQKRIHQNS